MLSHDLERIALLIRRPSSLPVKAGDDLRTKAREVLGVLAQTTTPDAIRHPYGFVVVHLARFGDGSALRLHLWPIGDRPRQEPDWPLHDHAWDFRSFVCTGRLRHEIHRPTPGDDFRVYEVEYDANASNLVRTNDRLSTELLENVEVEADTVYGLSSSLFHTVDVAEGESAVSLVVTAPPSLNKPRVLGELNAKASYRFSRDRIDPSIVKSNLGKLCGAMPDA